MKTLKYFIPVVLAFFVIAGCQKETVSKDEVKGEELCVTVTADVVETSNEDGSKTAMVDDGANPYAKWLSTDKIRLWEFMDGEKKNYFQTSSTTLSSDEKTATFTLSTFGKAEGGTTYTYTAIYPSAGVQPSQSNDFYYFEIPASQTLSGNNFDPSADILVGKPQNRSSRLTALENLEFQFKRPGTVVKLTLMGIEAGEKISSVIITAPNENKIAGRCKVDMLTGVVSDKAYYGGTNKISLSCDDVVATGSDVFFFRCLDGTWAQGSEVSVKVTTDVAEYSKASTLPKDYVFADGGLTRFGFKDLTREAGLDTYVKYTGDLVEGDYIICSGTSAMKNVISSDRMTIETVTVTDDKIQTKDASKIWHIEDSGSYWTLYNDDVKKYASSTGAKNKMALSDNKGDDKSLWTASYSSGWEFVNKQNSASSVNANLRCNGNLGFACYSTSTGSSLTLYINSADLKEPLSTPVITVTGNHFTKTISVEWVAVPNATGYEVSCTGKDKISTTGTSCQFTGLAAGEYSVTVKAVDNTGTYRSSKTTTNCTLGDPSITLSTTSIQNVPAASDIYDNIEYSLSYAEEKDLVWTCDGAVVSEVDADEGTLTYTVEENTTDKVRDGWIKVTLNGAVQTITVSQLAQGGKQDQTITFSQASYTVKMGETITQTVSGAMTTVTYSSSDTAIATVDQDGKVTPVAAGSCTIYADAAEDATYNAAQTSYELTVQASKKTWTYTVSTDTPKLNTSNPAIVNGATWSIVMGTKVGSPTTNGAPTNSYSKCGWKWGNSSTNYWKSYTLSTDYFTEKKVSKVTVNFLNNGSKSATMTIMQGTTTIGTDTKTFGNTWTDLSANAKQGTSGTLTIQYSVDQASLINSITVEYLD